MQRITIVTPARPSLHNGNWSTTARWAEFLKPNYEVTVTQSWDGEPCDLMLALHARKSAPSIHRFAKQKKPLVVVLTGTDVYRDIQNDPSSQTSLDLATRLIVLQERAPDAVPERQRHKCVVIEQSAPRLAPQIPRKETFDLLLVGHMRPVKDPLTALRSMQHVTDPTARLRHIGLADHEAIGPTARQHQAVDSRIEFLGVKNHEQTRQMISFGRILLLPSLLEGGANVVIEAIMSSTPVLASAIPGSIGLLGADYDGYFPVGDDRQLGKLIERAISSPEWLSQLTQQGQDRSILFEPTRERRLLQALVRELFDNC